MIKLFQCNYTCYYTSLLVPCIMAKDLKDCLFPTVSLLEYWSLVNIKWCFGVVFVYLSQIDLVKICFRNHTGDSDSHWCSFSGGDVYGTFYCSLFIMRVIWLILFWFKTFKNGRVIKLQWCLIQRWESYSVTM